MACLSSLEHHLTLSDDPSINLATSGLEPTPIDPSRIVAVREVPFHSSPICHIWDKGFLAALCDTLKSDESISSTMPRKINIRLSLSPTSMFVADEVESMMRKGRKERDDLSNSPEALALWGRDGIRKLGNMETVVPDQNREPTITSCFSLATLNSRKSRSNESKPISSSCTSAESSCSTVTVQTGAIVDSLALLGEIQRGETAAMFRRMNQSQQWYQQYLEMVKFRETYGHCLVPLKWPANPSLAHWVSLT